MGDSLNNISPQASLPEHVGIIMDGNGRWAKKHGLNRSEGHKQGAKTFRNIAEYAVERGIRCLTFYAFSTENWSRPPEEINSLMQLFREYMEEARERKQENEEKGIRIRFIGETKGLPEDIIELIEKAQQQTMDKNYAIVNIAMNYGGRQEILHSVKCLAEKAASGLLNPEDITEDMISEGLYTYGLTDPDLIIRPSGELRLSNFLIWQCAYSELWFSDILWPDFKKEDFDSALDSYSKRKRRFGGI